MDGNYYEIAAKAAQEVMLAQSKEIERLKKICEIKDVIINAGTGHYQLLMKFHGENIRLHQEITVLKRQLAPVELSAEQRKAKIAQTLQDYHAKPYYCTCPKCTGEIKETKKAKSIVCKHCKGMGNERFGMVDGEFVKDKCTVCGGTGIMEVEG